MKHLMDYREDLYLTMDEYAKLLDVTVETLYKIKRGHRPRPNTMRKIAEKLGVHPSEIAEFAPKKASAATDSQ